MDAAAMTAPTATRLLDNYVGGAWTPAAPDAAALDVTNPATGEQLARVPLSTAADLDAAVAAAAVAFLHAQEDRHEPLLLVRPGQRGVLRGTLGARLDDGTVRRSSA
jgi:hypothetical protein